MSADFERPGTWIWTKDPYDKEQPVIVLFRKELILENKPEHCRVRLSADSRYRFFVNGASVCQGPVKGDRQVWYYDEADLAPYLVQGSNVLSAIVLRYPMLHENGNFSIARTEKPGFFMDGDLCADTEFLCRVADGVRVVKANPFFEPLCITEVACGDASLNGWQKTGYQPDTAWKPAVMQHVMNGFDSPGNLKTRPIPFLYEKDRRFTEVMTVREGQVQQADWQAFLSDAAHSVTIPAHSKAVVELHAGELMTGFLELKLEGGCGADIKILAAESYARTDEERLQQLLARPELKNVPQEQLQGILQFAVPMDKNDRLDWEHGRLFGMTDQYIAAGYGTEEEPEYYEPFWFRTFRFIQLCIETKDEPLTLKDFTYRETGYPLEVKTSVTTSDETLQPIWDISERTLRRCMHETYEDCPYYEQLQYVMDSRFQILATYMISADDRLARKAIEDFARSQRWDGLVEGAYPSFGSNAIVNFSIFYILMVWDHWRFFGDRAFTERFLPVMERIVDFYRARVDTNGLVERTSEGGQGGNYWSFVDWVPAWERGVPTAILQGNASVESLLYLLGLEKLSDMEKAFSKEGWESKAQKHHEEAESLKEAIRRYYMDEEGLITDGLAADKDDRKAFTEHSQHGQVLATLTEVFSPEEAKAAMTRALEDPAFHQCTVSWGYYLFRALEKSGLYERTETLWEPWRDMIRAHLTTCVESNGIKGRSDCHAWGALALYELPAVILGVRPVTPGFETVCVRPVPGYLTRAEGEVITPKGKIYVRWTKKEDGTLDLTVRAPEGMHIIQ